MTSHLWVAVTLCLFISSCAASCTSYTGASGTVYDLSSLTKPTNAPWTGKEANPNFEYYWNFCQNLQGVPSQVGSTGPATVIQIDLAANAAYAVGKIDTQAITEISGGLEFTYKNNVDSFCRDVGGTPNIQRTTTIMIACDEGSSGDISSITEPSNPSDPNFKCRYQINMKHKAACKKGSGIGPGGLSGGSIFLIIFFVLATVYVVGGIVFNKVRNNAEGVDMIPNFGFWASIPGLVVDGFKFIKNKFTGGSYSSL